MNRCLCGGAVARGLTRTRTRYYSQGDERAFFEWLAPISCVVRFEGVGDTPTGGPAGALFVAEPRHLGARTGRLGSPREDWYSPRLGVAFQPRSPGVVSMARRFVLAQRCSICGK